MECCQFCPQVVLNLYLFGHCKEIKQPSRKSAFSAENVMEMVMEKSWKICCQVRGNPVWGIKPSIEPTEKNGFKVYPHSLDNYKKCLY